VEFDYSLTALLPFARAAIRQTSNFALSGFFDNLFAELEKAHVNGVVPATPPTYVKYVYNDLACPEKLRRGAIEVFCHLRYRGFIAPEPQGFPQAFNYWKTPRGTVRPQRY
jgi:hypothetical protein